MRRGWPSDWQPGQPPPQLQFWWGPGPQQPTRDVAATAPVTPIRNGDAARDQAVSDLGDHFAAGRLSRAEFDDRADQAMQARFSTDLAPLFVDLPQTAAAQPESQQRRAGGPPRWAYAIWLLPFLAMAAVAGAVLLHAPFLIWGLVWVVVILKITGHKRRYRREQLGQPPFSQPPFSQPPFSRPGRR